MNLLEQVPFQIPIIQAPMAGVSTVAMAAAVSESGALGSMAIGAMDANTADQRLAQLRQLTAKPVNINVFSHQPAKADPESESAWLHLLQPYFAQFGGDSPAALQSPYRAFDENDDLFEVLLAHRPTVVSFHFGVPTAARIAALKSAGCLLFGSVTTLAEGSVMVDAGVDVLVAQGVEAGGHRGIFDPNVDAKTTTSELVDKLMPLAVPIVAAGGVLYGSEIKSLLDRGAQAVQLGTAFIGAQESAANAAFRQALMQPELKTRITTVISGRPARGIENQFMRVLAPYAHQVPAYPIAYAAGKALHEAAQRTGSNEFSAMWASRHVPSDRHLSAADIVKLLVREM